MRRCASATPRQGPVPLPSPACALLFMKKVLPIHRVAATLLPGVAFVLLLGSAARLHAQECLTFRTQKCPRKAGIKAWGGGRSRSAAAPQRATRASAHRGSGRRWAAWWPGPRWRAR